MKPATILTALSTLFALLSLTLLAGLAPAEAQSSDKIVGVIWEDTNCDGIHQDTEPLMPNVTITLRYAGENGEIDGTDYDIQSWTPSDATYRFSWAGAEEPYFISIRGEHKPAGYVPAPFRQGDDRTRDNDMTVGLLPGTSLWATPVFWMPADGSQVTDLDIGLCKLVLDKVAYLPLVAR
jgi:hypothetical protein